MGIDWTTVIVSLGSAVISGIFALVARRQAKEALHQALSSRTHADRAVQASLRPREERHGIPDLVTPVDDNTGWLTCMECLHPRSEHFNSVNIAIQSCRHKSGNVQCDCKQYV